MPQKLPMKRMSTNRSAFACAVPIAAAAVSCAPTQLTAQSASVEAGSAEARCLFVELVGNHQLRLGVKVTSPCRTNGIVHLHVLRGQEILQSTVLSRVLTRDESKLVSAAFNRPSPGSRLTVFIETNCGNEAVDGMTTCDYR